MWSKLFNCVFLSLFCGIFSSHCYCNIMLCFQGLAIRRKKKGGRRREEWEEGGSWSRVVVILWFYYYCCYLNFVYGHIFRRNMENPVGYAKEEAIIHVSYAKQRVQYSGHHYMILWWLTHVSVPPVRETSKGIFFSSCHNFIAHKVFVFLSNITGSLGLKLFLMWCIVICYTFNETTLLFSFENWDQLSWYMNIEICLLVLFAGFRNVWTAWGLVLYRKCNCLRIKGTIHPELLCFDKINVWEHIAAMKYYADAMK